MTNELAIRILTGDVLGTSEQTKEAVTMAVKALSQPDADTSVGDSISRQAAIRWVKTECNPYGNPTLDFESGKKVIKHLEQMPSIQPEILACGEGELNVPDTNVGDTISRQAAIEAARHAWAKGLEPTQYLEELPPAQPKQQWIPCSEETPKKTDYYICTCHDGVCYRTSVLKWSTGWILTGARAYWKVIAWMPLPNPWKEETDEHTKN